MKRVLSIVLALVLTASFGSAVCAAEEIKLYLNGNEIQPLEENHQYAHIENGTVYLPLRNIFEAMGALVEWYGDNEVVTCRGIVNFSVYFGEKRMILNDEEIYLSSTTKVLEDRAFIEKAVIEKAMNAYVNDNNPNNIYITYDENYGMEIDFSGLVESYDE